MDLVIMAAGMGSRFGGLKQVEPINQNGEFILDYSKTEKELGYHPQHTFKTYLEDFKREMEKQPFRKIWGLESDYYEIEE